MKTPNDGATLQRRYLKAKIRRMLKKEPTRDGERVLRELMNWLSNETYRTSKRRGGLGRK